MGGGIASTLCECECERVKLDHSTKHYLIYIQCILIKGLMMGGTDSLLHSYLKQCWWLSIEAAAAPPPTLPWWQAGPNNNLLFSWVHSACRCPLLWSRRANTSQRGWQRRYNILMKHLEHPVACVKSSEPPEEVEPAQALRGHGRGAEFDAKLFVG